MHFMTAAQLEISDAERDALIKLLHQFRTAPPPTINTREEDDYTDANSFALDDDEIETLLGFNMTLGGGIANDLDSLAKGCGSIACIGGHVHLLMNGHDTTGHKFPVAALAEANDYVMKFDTTVENKSRSLYKLYFPWTVDSWGRITPIMAADAIENFLTAKDPKYPDVLKKHGISPSRQDD